MTPGARPLDDEEAYAEARARYEADPMLALAESYVLDAIGELGPDEVVEVADASEELLGDRDFRSAVRRELAWTAAVDGEIARAWGRHREERWAAGDAPDAAGFAREFADAAARRSRS